LGDGCVPLNHVLVLVGADESADFVFELALVVVAEVPGLDTAAFLGDDCQIVPQKFLVAAVEI
jgi:hypothetical protein